MNIQYARTSIIYYQLAQWIPMLNKVVDSICMQNRSVSDAKVKSLPNCSRDVCEGVLTIENVPNTKHNSWDYFKVENALGDSFRCWRSSAIEREDGQHPKGTHLHGNDILSKKIQKFFGTNPIYQVWRYCF
jgi:hypothetical protein